jgi:hypothetical protein
VTALRKDGFAIKEVDMIDANLRTRNSSRDAKSGAADAEHAIS